MNPRIFRTGIFVASLLFVLASAVYFSQNRFGNSAGGITGTIVLMDASPLGGNHVYRQFYNWHNGYGKDYSQAPSIEPSIGFALPGSTCDVSITVCDSSGNAGYQKLFIDPGAATEKIGKGCAYIYSATWGCFTDRFTGVSGGVRKFTIGTWGGIEYAGDYNWRTMGDRNSCIVYDVPGHTANNNNDPGVNYYPTTHPRYFGYANSYIPHLNYASVSYACT